MLYQTKVEYGDYTMNHVQGCSHGCKYPCYAMMMAKRFGKVASYEKWCEPALVSNTLELLDKELPKLRSKMKSVQLCFTTDSFMYGYEDICDMSIKAIERINQEGVPCVVLSKGALPAELADSRFLRENAYGITLVSLDERYRKENEPGAAPYSERIQALQTLHDNGSKTWVSMEPYPTPNIIDQDLIAILEAVSFADRIIFGRTNYNKIVSAFPKAKEWYNAQAVKVARYCTEHDIDWYIKRGTWTRNQPIEDVLAEICGAISA